MCVLADYVVIGGNKPSSSSRSLSDDVAVEITPYNGSSSTSPINPLMIVLLVGAGVIGVAAVYFLAKKGGQK
jgi:threonine dehydrogenase-like Zn-dependent dehydrogenase